MSEFYDRWIELRDHTRISIHNREQKRMERIEMVVGVVVAIVIGCFIGWVLTL